MTTRTTLENRLLSLAAMIGIILASLAVTGCGSSDDGTSASATGPEVAVASTGTITVPGDGPVDTTILIDRTSLRKDAALSNGYVTAGQRIAEPTITRGGALKILAFGAVAGRAVPVYATDIPPLAEAGPAARDDAAEAAAAKAALDIAVGLTEPPSRDDAQALAEITKGPGTDQARMIRDEIRDLGSSTADAQIVGMATDGLIDQRELQLARVLAKTDHDGTTAGKKITGSVRLPDGFRKLSLLQVTGIGLTGGKSDRNGAALDQLTGAWETACASWAERCVVDTRP